MLLCKCGSGAEALFPNNKMLFLPEDNAGHPVTEA